MKVLQGKGKARPDREAKQRNALLAMVHIAIKELGITRDDYRTILKWQFNQASAADLSIMELQYLVEYFVQHGWKSKRRQRTDNRRQTTEDRGRTRTRKTDNGPQLEALRERAIEVAGELENGERRLRGLCRKLCGVDRIEWCTEVRPLKGLVAALERILAADLRG